MEPGKKVGVEGRMASRKGKIAYVSFRERLDAIKKGVEGKCSWKNLKEKTPFLAKGTERKEVGVPKLWDMLSPKRFPKGDDKKDGEKKSNSCVANDPKALGDLPRKYTARSNRKGGGRSFRL